MARYHLLSLGSRGRDVAVVVVAKGGGDCEEGGWCKTETAEARVMQRFAGMSLWRLCESESWRRTSRWGTEKADDVRDGERRG